MHISKIQNDTNTYKMWISQHRILIRHPIHDRSNRDHFQTSMPQPAAAVERQFQGMSSQQRRGIWVLGTSHIEYRCLKRPYGTWSPVMQWLRHGEAFWMASAGLVWTLWVALGGAVQIESHPLHSIWRMDIWIWLNNQDIWESWLTFRFTHL